LTCTGYGRGIGLTEKKKANSKYTLQIKNGRGRTGPAVYKLYAWKKSGRAKA